MKTILVVDDEYAILDALRAFLEDEGYRVVTASDGREALVRLRESIPDVILLDMMMPFMDGRDALRAIRAEPAWQSIPVVLMSAGLRALAASAPLGPTAVLHKPFGVDQLVTLLDEVMARR